MLDTYFLFIFIFDFALNLFTATSKKVYLRSFNGIIDLISILGSMFKVLRLLRLFKLDKEIKIISALKCTFKEKREALIELNMFLLITLLMGSYILMVFEPETFQTLGSTLYYCVICISTVGFGDILPSIPITRFVTILIIIVGQSIFIIDLLIISNGIIKHRNIEVE